jgi:MerR family transcriptional regulator, thiopeptide resistance regulator
VGGDGRTFPYKVSASMKPSNTYYVREFAQMAGVTVRTLHYYDSTGLLKPSRDKASRSRLYKSDDLLRLQQILTLKYMGFTLEEIADLLDSPDYDVRRSLHIQKSAIDQRIAQLQQVSRALEQTISAVDEHGDAGMDWAQVGDVIRGITQQDELKAWAQRHYSAEQMAQFEAQTVTPEQIAEWTRQWSQLYADFGEAKARGLPVDHPEVQAVAARMGAMIDGFTRGDESLMHNLRAMWSDEAHIPGWIQRDFDLELGAYAAQAWEAWRKG